MAVEARPADIAAAGAVLDAAPFQALTDLGRAPTFYDCLVQVEAAGD
jgi:hypothetical protein